MRFIEEIERLPATVRERAERRNPLGLDGLVGLVRDVRPDPANTCPLPGDDAVACYDPDDIPSVRSAVSLGEAAIAKGEVAVVILAGGVSDLITAPVPRIGTSLLAWHLMQVGAMPTLIMASAHAAQSIQDAVRRLVLPPGMRGSVLGQFEGYRLTPDMGLVVDDEGIPILGGMGHGDLGPVLLENDVLDEFPTVKHLYVYNATNAFASPHPEIIGRHLQADVPITVEVVDRDNDIRGGVVASIDGVPQVVESHRLELDDFCRCGYLSTNSMVIDARVFRQDIEWRWHRVRRVVDRRLTIGYERSLQQYTERFRSQFIRVERSRYMPARSIDDLERVGTMLSTYRFT